MRGVSLQAGEAVCVAGSENSFVWDLSPWSQQPSMVLASLNSLPFPPFICCLRDLVLRPRSFPYTFPRSEHSSITITFPVSACLGKGGSTTESSGGVRAEVSLTGKDLQSLRSWAESRLRPGHHFVWKRSDEWPRSGRPAGQRRGGWCLALEPCDSRCRPAAQTMLENLPEMRNLELYPCFVNWNLEVIGRCTVWGGAVVNPKGDVREDREE